MASGMLRQHISSASLSGRFPPLVWPASSQQLYPCVLWFHGTPRVEDAGSPELQQKSQGVAAAGHLWVHVHLVVDRLIDPWVGQAWVKPAPNSIESTLVNTWAEGGAATQRKGN